MSPSWKRPAGRASCEVLWQPETELPRHPNALKISLLPDGVHEIYYSVGGGKIVKDQQQLPERHIYPLDTMNQIMQWCETSGRPMWEYVFEHEDADLPDYLNEVWKVMKSALKAGLDHEGVLPGGLNLPRKASGYYAKATHFSGPMGKRSKVYAYALAVSEENAAGGMVVTAPTCGSAGCFQRSCGTRRKSTSCPKAGSSGHWPLQGSSVHWLRSMLRYRELK